jgi:PAS domain-containing protein
LSAVVHDLPADLSAAVLVQQHLTVPASRLNELLGGPTRYEVVWAVEGAVAGSGRVSVCPPGMRMEILPDGTCLLAARERYKDRPHDLLLASLAESYGPRALAVVLTGEGSDGAAGTAALKAAGGVIIAQSEDTAEHPSMPRAAAEAGADLVLPLYEIAGVVADIVRGGPLPRPHEEAQAIRAVFGDVGEAAALARDVDWASSPLGAVCEWPEARRTVVRMGMDSTDPVAVWLGQSQVFLCNDAAIRTLGGNRFAAAFGRPRLEADPKVGDLADPLFASVMVGEGVHQSAMFVPRERHGKSENGWYDRSVTPIRERDGAVAGVYQVWIERTTEVLAARRLQTLSRLAAATAGHDRQEALQSTLAVLDKAADVPFAAAYLLDASSERVSLAGAVGVAEDGTMAPAVLRLAPGGGWPLYQAVEQRHPVLVDDVAARFGGQLGWTPFPCRAAARR